jgi:predicted CopG family antitoxin
MTSKMISVTNEVYDELSKLKEAHESFSELFMRMVHTHRQNLEKCFGCWKLDAEEEKDIWSDLIVRPGRQWTHSNIDELK